MPRKRRKLSKEMEAEIKAAQKKVEFISAMIRDIREEDIQNEYAEAFSRVHVASAHLTKLYDSEGVTEESEGTLALYKGLLSQFEEDYEL
ncbi:hypothetical protein [Synechococcus sp. BMK-MC-1]|uniref:hypothetical protein n=1 Tax=Synechococcus sp. BMK-MC-1 TaxID=1442551 RepID=UPI001645F962|nr:hypothetical protein [Synechococcus sp. BMK-MC-1]QNI67017.1 hypothetical protein SynBMKMC1_00933 [Synechococcus sp. BMK-MC-1]